MLTRDRLGAFVAVFFGTAVVALTLTLLASASPRVPERYAAVAVAVRSPAVTTPADPFPEPRPWSSDEATALAGRLAAVPGVEAAVPDRRFYAQPVIAGVPVRETQEGHGWAGAALAPDRLVAGHPPAADREVAVDRSLGVPVGGAVTVLTATGPAPWTVSGLIDAPRLYVADLTAARLSPGVRVIGLTGHPDPAQVQRAAAGATVLHGDSLGDLEARSDARTRWIGLQVLSAMAALSAFACVFVIASTFALNVHQRRREIGLLRTIGATPRQVRRMVLTDAAAVGVGAALAGVFLGTLLAPVLGKVLVDAGFEPDSFEAGFRIWPVLVALGAGPLVSVAGSLAAARRAARIGPLEALRQAEVETRPMTRARWVAGLLFAAAGAAAGVATAVTDDLTNLATFALLGAMALVVAATLLAPAVVPPVVRTLLRPARGPIGMVMRESALTGARRTASTAAPVLLTIAFAVFIAGNVRTSADAYADRRAEAVGTETVLVPDGAPGLSDAVAGSASLPTDVYLGDTVVSATGVDSAPAISSADSVVVANWLAAQRQIGIDDTIEATFADGARVPLRITAVAPEGANQADLVLARATVRAHDPSALAAVVPVTTGSAPSSVVGGKAVAIADYARQADAEEDRLVWIFTLLLIGVSVGYGALAVANTLFMATSRRAPDYRLLRMAGATPRQVLLAIAGESALVVAVGAVLGATAAVLALWGTTVGLRAQTGTEVPAAIPWPTAAAAVVVCVLLALAGSVLPARGHVTRIGPTLDET